MRVRLDKMINFNSLRLEGFCCCLLLSLHLLVEVQAVDQPTKCEKKYLQIVILVDSSTSINENIPPNSNVNNWEIVRTFLKDFVNLLPISDGEVTVSVVPFSTTVHEELSTNLLNSKSVILNNLDKMPYVGGNTNTSGALRKARWILANASSTNFLVKPTKVIILITDGLSNVDSSLTLQEARINKQMGIVQYAVGVTKYIDGDELEDLVTDPASYYYLNASDFTHLNSRLNDLLQRLTCPQPPLMQPCINSKADIVFILDASGSIVININGTPDYSNWITMKNFFINVVRNLNVSLDQTRIALISFSHVANVSFYLNNYNTADEIVEAISNVSIIGSQTNTAAALQLMTSDVFTANNGDRPDVENVAIVMTDGQSNIDQNETIPKAVKAKNQGIQLFAIGLTNEINIRELQGISSLPLDQHCFNRTTYSLVGTLVSNLVWSVCQKTCALSDASCRSGTSNQCKSSETITWTMYSGSLIIGHDYATITDISTPEACKSICLQDAQCRSIEYIPIYKECSVSYYRKSDVEQSFRNDPEVNYYEWTCTK